MKIIVAVDKNWGIGYKGDLLQYIPEDMRFFKEKTLNKVVIMGRETLDSLPNGEPLKDRVNIVLTRDKSFKKEGIVICNSIEETLKQIEKFKSDNVFIIGGESIYKQFLNYCDELFITKIQNEYKADKFFPNIDILESWELISESETKEYKGIKYSFCKYKNR